MVMQQDLFELMGGAAQTEDAPAPVEDAPTQVEDAPTHTPDAAAPIEAASTRVEDAAGQIEHAPTQVEDTPAQAGASGAFDFWEHVAARLATFDMPAVMLDFARELARFEPGLTPPQQRALAVLILATMLEVQRGSTRTWVGDLMPNASDDLLEDGGQKTRKSTSTPTNIDGAHALIRALLLTDPAPPAEPRNTPPGTVITQEFQAVLRSVRWLLTPGNAPTILGRPGDYRPLILDQGHLYHQRNFYYENALVDALGARLNQPLPVIEPDLLKTALEDVLAHMPAAADGQAPMVLSGEQQYALLLGATRPISVISGGPGTGKTSIVVSLLRLLTRLGLKPEEIALGAPTGKAAHRLSASVLTQLSALRNQPDARPLNVADQCLLDALEPARTLHRLLGYSPARDDYYYHHHHRLPYQVVIVDEASMIDLFLMERLLRAVAPEARLILLGDADQLPSVETGSIFRDLLPAQISLAPHLQELVAAAPIDLSATSVTRAPAADEESSAARAALGHHAMRLQKSYRMDPRRPEGADILRAAQALNAGEALTDFTQPVNPIHLRQDFAHVLHAGVELCEPDAASDAAAQALRNEFVPWWYAHLLQDSDEFGALIAAPLPFDGERFTPEATTRLEKISARFQRAQALSATRVFRTGSESLNASFHARHLSFLDTLREKGALGAPRGRASDFAIGEPVLMLKNDYQRGLFNGAHGIIVAVQHTADHPASDHRRGVEVMAVFRRDAQLVPFSLSTLAGHTEHAYALTIHKAQGSEYDQVAIVLPAEPLPLLTRELLYTGMTRSRRSVVLVGAREQLATAAARAARRDSGIPKKLATRASQSPLVPAHS